MKDLVQSPLFGITLTLLFYIISNLFYQKTRFFLFMPLIFSITSIILILITMKIPYDAYNTGGKYISMWVGPATVALALKLEQNYKYLKANYLLIILSVGVGVLFHTLLIISFAVLFNFDRTLTFSLIPKSVTTAIAVSISESSGGISALTVSLVAVTGIIGSMIGPPLLKILGVKDAVAQGVAMGAGAHAIGTARAIKMGEIQGGMASLAMIITGIITVLMIPIANFIVTMLIK